MNNNSNNENNENNKLLENFGNKLYKSRAGQGT